VQVGAARALVGVLRVRRRVRLRGRRRRSRAGGQVVQLQRAERPRRPGGEAAAPGGGVQRVRHAGPDQDHRPQQRQVAQVQVLRHPLRWPLNMNTQPATCMQSILLLLHHIYMHDIYTCMSIS